MRDQKHRVMSTIILLISILIAYWIFNSLSVTRGNEVAAVIAFSTGILIVVAYQLYNFKNLKHKVTKINSMTQIWLGLMFVVASIFVLILTAMNVEFSTALMWMSGVVLALLFLSIKRFDLFLEKNIK